MGDISSLWIHLICYVSTPWAADLNCPLTFIIKCIPYYFRLQFARTPSDRRIWAGVSWASPRAPHPASTAPSNWTYFHFHFNKLKSHLFPIVPFQKDFPHSFNFQLFLLLLNAPKIFCPYFLLYCFPITFNPTIHTEYNTRKITCLKGVFEDNWKERISS